VWDDRLHDAGRESGRGVGMSGQLFTPLCGCAGCHEEAAARIDHPNGTRTVCEGHINGHEVIEVIDDG
jgi:hypothetical protein